MGLYFRKSIRVGPLRFNLSKSGIGVSAGIPGIRVGAGPRGNYVQMGVGGLYYRSTLPSNPTPTSQPRVSESSKPPQSHAPLEYVATADISQMTDSSSASLLSELDQKSKRTCTWPLAAGLGGAISCILMFAQASDWILVSVVAFSLISVFAAYQFDLMSKSVVILYDLDTTMEHAYQQIHSCMIELASCGGKWHIDARGHVYDPKYHGGAGQLVNRKPIEIRLKQPPFVKTNIAIPCIPLGARTLYFFPERTLVFTRDGVGAVSYKDLRLSINDKRFIESESVPRDAQVIDHTWQYVNKNGGPDRRFNNNRMIPICLYEELWLNSHTGLNEVIQVSRTGIGKPLDAAFQNLAGIVAKAAAIPPPTLHAVPSPTPPVKHPIGQQPTAANNHIPNQLLDVLFEILCCLMIADGRVANSEKSCIRKVMAELRSPWAESEIDDRMTEFVSRVQKVGYQKTLVTALKGVEIFKRLGKQNLLLRCLNTVAKADNKITQRELQLYQRIKAIVK